MCLCLFVCLNVFFCACLSLWEIECKRALKTRCTHQSNCWISCTKRCKNANLHLQVCIVHVCVVCVWFHSNLCNKRLHIYSYVLYDAHTHLHTNKPYTLVWQAVGWWNLWKRGYRNRCTTMLSPTTTSKIHVHTEARPHLAHTPTALTCPEVIPFSEQLVTAACLLLLAFLRRTLVHRDPISRLDQCSTQREQWRSPWIVHF